MNLKSDIEIAQDTKELPITEIAKKVDLQPDEIELYGNDKAKISWKGINRIKQSKELGKLILLLQLALRQLVKESLLLPLVWGMQSAINFTKIL